MPPTLSTLKKAGYSAFIVGCLALVAEMVFTPLAPQEPPDQVAAQRHAMPAHPILGWAPTPGPTTGFGVPQPTTINEAGTRNPAFQPKAPGTRRLLTLGDSTVFGAQVADAEVFGAVAAAELSVFVGEPIEPINGGIPGYSSAQSSRLLAGPLASVEPDWVVVANLWSDTQPTAASDSEVFLDRSGSLHSVLVHLATYRWLRSVLTDHRNARPIEWRIRPGDNRTRVLPEDYRSNLRAMARTAQELGADTVFLWLPSDRDLRQQPLEAPRPQYRQIMAEVAEESDSLIVDGATPFRGGDPALMADDLQPSARGHALLGHTLALALAKRGRPRP